ncbi:MAG: outer membrane protein assembly factor BamD [Sulfurimonas sp.]|nr:outer membrane protein assembly factor BamD [Sulfurimonas sp.]PHQ90772.1 MAG: outer membrane protein assembly factor BamD [Sulfurimonas sp.]
MKRKTYFSLILLITLFIFVGCSKDVDEYNKPAVYWYGEMIKSVANADLEKADSYYSSLQGEHIGSPLLPEATMILAIAHMHYEEYLLSEHFANEYVKRYANINEKEFAEFLKIKAKYRALPNPRRDQVLIKEAIKESGIFKRTYPYSMYYPVVDTMLSNLRMAEALLNESIAELYIRLDKPRSAEYYRNIKPQEWIVWDEIDRAKTPWYREWFEGDGTQSWYAFIIPDTQSVVSRNTIQEDFTPGLLEEMRETDAIDESLYEKVEDTSVSKQQRKELSQAQDLRDEGILTAEEYEGLEKEILDTNDEAYFKSKDITQKTRKQEKELKSAQDLLDDGILNKEEFENLKEEILR